MLRTMISRPTGVIMEPPAPCTIWASTNASSECEAAEPIEPSANTPITARKTFGYRIGRRSSRWRDADCQRQQIRGDGELQGQRIDAERLRNRRQRRGDDRRVHVLTMNKAVATISGTMRSAGDECILGGYRLFGQPICRWYANLMPAASPPLGPC